VINPDFETDEQRALGNQVQESANLRRGMREDKRMC
jgi:hypothetical protein